MTTSSVPARLAVIVASLSLACATTAGTHPHIVAENQKPQSQPPQLTSSVPRNGADLAAWPGRATLTFNQPVTSASVTLTGPQGSVDTGAVTTKGSTCSVVLPGQQSSGRYIMTFSAHSGTETTTGSIAFTIEASHSTPGAPSETGTGNNGGLIWVIAGVSVLGGAMLVVFITRRRAVTKGTSSTGKNPDHL